MCRTKTLHESMRMICTGVFWLASPAARVLHVNEAICMLNEAICMLNARDITTNIKLVQKK